MNESELARCPFTGKLIFPSKRVAREELRKATHNSRRRNHTSVASGKLERRTFYCEGCNGHHLTSQNRGVNKR